MTIIIELKGGALNGQRHSIDADHAPDRLQHLLDSNHAEVYDHIDPSSGEKLFAEDERPLYRYLSTDDWAGATPPLHTLINEHTRHSTEA